MIAIIPFDISTPFGPETSKNVNDHPAGHKSRSELLLKKRHTDILRMPLRMYPVFSVFYSDFTFLPCYRFIAFFVSASASSIRLITSSISCCEITADGSKRIVFALTSVPAVMTPLANNPFAVSYPYSHV